MANDNVAWGSLLLGITIGLVLLVYGMWLSAGQSLNLPAIVGGAVSLGAFAVMAAKIARLEHPTH